jgi:DHA1 family bicyclomycin/chloramphenicol resistance-like MFS transporter
MFAIVALGQLGGSTLNRMLAMRIAPSRLIRVGGGLTVVATLVIGLFTFWTVPIPALLLAIALYAFALGMTNPNAIAAAMTPLPQYAGAASAVIGFLYFVMGSIGASLSGYLLPGTVTGMLGIITGFGTAGILVFIWLEVHQAKQTRMPV